MSYKVTTPIFIEKAIKIHGSKYIYSKVNYIHSQTKVCIICPNHGEFWQIPKSHLHGSGCPKCKTSKGELLVEKILEKHNIEYINQKTFDDCKDKILLRFDKYIPSYNLCIEYDGLHHFQPVIFGKMSKNESYKNFKETQKRDKIKNNYCKNQNIPILRIKYTLSPKQVENKILEFIQNL